MLEINDLNIIFNEGTVNEKHALKDINLNLDKGDFLSIIGSNGAGKSTLLNSISGTYQIDSGKIILDNREIQNLKEYQRAKDIGRLFQDPLKGTAPDMSIEENLSLAYQRTSVKNSFYDKFIKIGLNEQETLFIKDRLSLLELGLENRFKDKVGLLSGGQRQALTLMMATINTPSLLLLDEHTAALDPKTAKQVMKITDDIIKENKITTIMITHNIKHALSYGNKMIVMSDGQIITSFNKEEKEKLSVKDIMDIYQQKALDDLSDKMLLD